MADILVVDDDDVIRGTLCELLSANHSCQTAETAEDALARLQAQTFDVVLTDISMPGLNGLKATAKLKDCCPEVHVLAVTRHKDDGYLQQVLKAGASGYVLKQSPPAELLHAIRAVANGGKYLDPTLAGKVMGRYSGRRSVINEGGTDVSDREVEVLRLVAWGHSNKEIASRLDLSVKTIEVHKANAMKKLGMASRIDIVRYAVLQGWLQDT